MSKFERSPNRHYIARDTKQPLVVLGAYPIAEDGSVMRRYINPNQTDTGADPLGNGQFRMVPSGEIVNLSERNRRLSK